MSMRYWHKQEHGSSWRNFWKEKHAEFKNKFSNNWKNDWDWGQTDSGNGHTTKSWSWSWGNQSSISGHVFFDKDKDGINENSDPAVKNVKVKLWDVESKQVVAVTYTDKHGNYCFDCINPGKYKVIFVTPDGNKFEGFTKKDQGNNDYIDSDANDTGNGKGITDVIHVGKCEHVKHVDAGLIKDCPPPPPPPEKSCISGRVFLDKDKDGIRESGEPPLKGVTVKLLDENGNEVATTTTNAQGRYSFDNLAAGKYKVVFAEPDNVDGFTLQDQGNNERRDSDVDSSGETDLIELDGHKKVDHVDAGVIKCPPPPPPEKSCISGRVFLDKDKDGIRESGEPPLKGVTVKLLDENGNEVATTTTNAQGRYSFDNLAAGKYKVVFAEPDNVDGFTLQDQGNNERRDSDVDSNGETDLIELDGHKKVDHVDAGVIKCPPPPPPEKSCISGRVFLDKDKDGIRESGEPPLKGVTVKLLDENGNEVATTTTNAQGRYSFDNLAAGKYKVVFAEPDNVDGFTLQDQGNNERRDSDVDSNGETDLIELDGHKKVDHVDAGVIKCPPPPPPEKSCISGRVFLDKDKDGIRESGEPPLKGVTVKLLDENGNEVATTTTNAQGRYSFDNLAAGKYKVVFAEPDNVDGFTLQDQGNNERRDSDVDSNGETDLIELDGHKKVDHVDAGVIKCPPPPPEKSCISGRVFLDKDKDGINESGDPAREGVAVKLVDKNGNEIASTTTDANGQYSFDNLAAGEYKVVFAKPADVDGFTLKDEGSDDSVDSDVNSSGATSTIVLNGYDKAYNVDAGLLDCPPPPPEKSCISGEVFLDKDGDGINESGDPAFAGITVRLLDENGNEVAFTTTDANGQYSFTGLGAGKYKVNFIRSSNFDISPKDQGTDDTVDSDINPNAQTDLIELDGHEKVDHVDAGLVKHTPPPAKSCISGEVFVDKDKDGINESGDPAREGVAVKLVDKNGNEIASTTTDANGQYSFDNLAAGEYKVVFAKPADVDGFTLKDEGSDDSVDSDVNSSGATSTIVLNGYDKAYNVDAGIVEKTPEDCVDLSIDKTMVNLDNASFGNISYAYSVLKFTLSVTNHSDKVASGVVVKDTIPENLDVWKTGDSLAFSDVNVRWNAGVWGDRFTGSPEHVDETNGTVTVVEAGLTPSSERVNGADPGYVYGETEGSVTWELGRNIQPGETVTLEYYGMRGLNWGYDPAEGTEFETKAEIIAVDQKDKNLSNNEDHLKVKWVSPVALDMNGDGKIGVTGETSSYQKDSDAELGRTVEFDIDADGDLDTIEWFDGSGDGILVDHNKIGANGKIDGSALFGDEGGKYANGYEKLKAHDANGDGQVSGAELEGLSLWKDDGDAVLEDGELVLATDAGVSSISTDMEIQFDDDGRALMRSTAIVNGEEVVSEDVWFAQGEEEENCEVCDYYDDAIV